MKLEDRCAICGHFDVNHSYTGVPGSLDGLTARGSCRRSDCKCPKFMRRPVDQQEET